MLRVLELEVVYHGVIRVLKRIDLVAPEKKIIALLGTNGAGKTTLIRSISGLLAVHNGNIIHGNIQWNGVQLNGKSSTAIGRQGIAQIMEGRRIFTDLTVEENLRLGAYGRRDRKIAQDVEHCLHLFPVLKQRFRGLAGYLSGGEQQMLSIGRALMARPSLLLMDEPSLGLAPIIVTEIARIIKQINAEGVTILLVEQNARLGLELSEYAYILENGEVAFEGRSEELLYNRDIQQFYLGISDGQKRKSFLEAKHYRKRKKWKT